MFMLLMIMCWLSAVFSGASDVVSLENASNSIFEYAISTRISLQKENAAKTVLVHVHIPKTGGTAVSQILTTNCSCRITDLKKRVCRKCKQVTIGKHHHFDYTVSRSTGWICGVHSPLAVMHSCLEGSYGSRTLGPLHLKKAGYSVVYIAFFRRPFDRFISEANFWHQFSAPDWNARIPKDRKNDTFGKLQEYVSFPEDYIIHNRQVKMIGGEFEDFDMEYRLFSSYGSRWNKVLNISQIQRHKSALGMPPTGPNNRKYLVRMHKKQTLAQAIDRLSNDQNIVVGLQERFLETVCVLEVLFGEQERFEWTPGENTHNPNQSFNITHATSKYDEWYNTTIYDNWLVKNIEDVQLYEYAGKVFEAQFNAVIDLLKSNNRTISYVQNHMPHCVTFLEHF